MNAWKQPDEITQLYVIKALTEYQRSTISSLIYNVKLVSCLSELSMPESSRLRSPNCMQSKTLTEQSSTISP